MTLDIRHLRVVDAIARHGTVTKAAERLSVTQPAVSHTLKDLETRLGVAIFTREPRQMVATREGERLLDTARVVLDEIDRAEYDLGRYKSGFKGIVRVATGCYTCYTWLPRILNQLKETFPEVDLQIVPEATRGAEQALLDGKLDLAILSELPASPAIETQELFTDELLVVVPPGHPLAGRTHVEPEDFAEETLLVHSRYEGGSLERDILSPAGVEPARVMAMQLSTAILESVSAGLGITVMAEWVVAQDLESGRLRGLRLTPDGVRRTWRAAFLARGSVPPPVQELVRLLETDAFQAAQDCAG